MNFVTDNMRDFAKEICDDDRLGFLGFSQLNMNMEKQDGNI